MTHKIRVSKDGINFEWVVINTWFNPVKVIWNPVMEDMEDAIQPKSYSKTNICSKCIERNEITNRSILYPRNGKIPQTKISSFRKSCGKEGGWGIRGLNRDWNKNIDIHVFYCVSKDEIERIYIFPKEVTLNIVSITIVKNSQLYDEYMVTDKKDIEKVNKIWMKI